LLNAGIGPPFIGSASKSDAARSRRDPEYNNQATMARSRVLAPLNNKNPVAKGRKTLRKTLAPQVGA